MKKARPLLLALAGLAAASAFAQFGPRERGPARPDRKPEQRITIPSQADAYALLVRELPSLRADLALRPEQRAAWETFERSVRRLAEIDRTRRRYLQSIRGPEPPQVTAPLFLGVLAESEREQGEAAMEARRAMDALHGALDDTQKAMLDRRVLQSQREPLNRETPPPN